MHLSVVAPAYRTQACLDELHRRLVKVLEAITPSFEIILVNDASPQEDWAAIRRLAAQDPRVKGINLSRNFGQHYALAAGIDRAEGDWVVVMDADLQDPPEEIPRLYAKALEGHDVVFGVKPRRNHGLLKRAASRAFTRVMSHLMDAELDNGVTHFSIVSRKVAANLRLFRERNRSYAFFLQWLGFDAARVEVAHHERYAGDGSYTLPRLLRLAGEIMVSQSDKPLRISIVIGFVIAALAFAGGLYDIARYLFWSYPVTGWTSLIVSIYFLGGITLVAVGVVGLYVGKIFDEAKRRPLYVVKDEVNFSAAPSMSGSLA